jgi:hypothetical protein
VELCSKACANALEVGLVGVAAFLRSGRTIRSTIFAGVRVYFNGAFSVRMATLHALVIENGGTVTWWKHDAAGKPTHFCTAGLTPSQIAEVK